ncbi:MAG: hypothetical protein V4482_00070 [Pseudomonadota bacterium]
MFKKSSFYIICALSLGSMFTSPIIAAGVLSKFAAYAPDYESHFSSAVADDSDDSLVTASESLFTASAEEESDEILTAALLLKERVEFAAGSMTQYMLAQHRTAHNIEIANALAARKYEVGRRSVSTEYGFSQ